MKNEISAYLINHGQQFTQTTTRESGQWALLRFNDTYSRVLIIMFVLVHKVSFKFDSSYQRSLDKYGIPTCFVSFDKTETIELLNIDIAIKGLEKLD